MESKILQARKKFHSRYNCLYRYAENRNKILIIRKCGGIGDILIHRMLFEDLKKQYDLETHFALPKRYHSLVQDHPFIDKILDCENLDLSQYPAHYDTSTACIDYENKNGIESKENRSDIWAHFCGFDLLHHDMHICLTNNEKNQAQKTLKQFNSPVFLFSPKSAIPIKNLTPRQIKYFEKRVPGTLVGIHHKNLGMKNQIITQDLREWMSLIHESNYVISVDSAAGHCAGGMKKPVLSIYTYVDGKTYTKYYPKSTLIQLHRDTHANWTCGPCYAWRSCTEAPGPVKPCISEITEEMINDGISKLIV